MKDDKAKFRAQYYGQKIAVLEWRQGHNPEPIVEMLFQDDIDHLLLTSLAQITDEHAEFVLGAEECRLRKNDPDQGDYGMSPSAMFVNDSDPIDIDWASDADYLRSKGYALHWLSYSVEKQISNGWVKIKE